MAWSCPTAVMTLLLSDTVTPAPWVEEKVEDTVAPEEGIKCEVVLITFVIARAYSLLTKRK